MLFRTTIVCAGCLLLLLVPLSSATSENDCVKGIKVPSDLDVSKYPPLWRLTSNPADPTASNAAGKVDPAVLVSAGVTVRFLDPSGYDYPNRTKQVPWAPAKGANNDPALQKLRDESDYQYADIVVVTAFVQKFYDEHIHAGGDEVRYVIDGSGYFDIRDVNDEWVRMHAKAGHFIEFPTGIEHRFTVDDKLYIQAMRLFPGSGTPDWSSVVRANTMNNNTARNAYVDKYLCGVDPDHDHVDKPTTKKPDETKKADGVDKPTKKKPPTFVQLRDAVATGSVFPFTVTVVVAMMMMM